jgi:cell division ATPase FtsA
MFEDRTIPVMAYNLETVLAEKFETTITRGITNTRMRDFYDIYILNTTQQFDAAIFKATLDKTIEKRGAAEQMAGINDTIAMIEESPVMVGLWQKYSNKYPYAAGVTWEMTIDAIKALAELAEE